MQRIVCDVFKTVSHEDMYLYVAQRDGLRRVPAELLERFGKPQKTLTFILQEGRSLARVAADTVMRNIDEQGYHLQLPPPRRSGEEILREGVTDD